MVTINTLITGTMTINTGSVLDTTKTRITFTDGTTEEYDWEGEIDRQTMIDAGLYDENGMAWIKNPQTVEIGSNVTSIGDLTFNSCDLTSVTIPESVTNISDGSFQFCSLLTSVTIPDSVKWIGAESFEGCKGMTSMTIGNGVTSIGDYAFYECENLMSVVFKGKTLEQVQNIEDESGNKHYPWGIDTSIITVA